MKNNFHQKSSCVEARQRKPVEEAENLRIAGLFFPAL